MKMISKRELVVLINNTYQAVEESNLGKIQEMKDDKLMINAIPFQVFLALISSLCPKSVEQVGTWDVREVSDGSVGGTLTI